MSRSLLKDALRFIESLKEVRAGLLGHLKLTIQTCSPQDEPWILLLEKVSIMLAPQQFSQYEKEEGDDYVTLETKIAAMRVTGGRL